jgi:undecaprenyl diphosphate synthase
LHIPPDTIDEQTIQNHLYSPNVPEVDLLVRTGGDKRLSNFLFWQCASSLFHFTPTYWPSLGEEDIDEALHAYSENAERENR